MTNDMRINRLLFGIIMATEPEGVPVAAERLDMVGNGRGGDMACFQAEATQRLDPELMRSAA